MKIAVGNRRILLQVGVAALLASQLQSLLSSLGYYELLFSVVVSRNTMSPPQLTRDTPVLDILQPVLVSSLVFCRIELQLVVHYRRQRDVGKMFHLQEPLFTETWLYRCVAVTLRVAHLINVVLYALHKSCCLEVLGNLLTTVHAVHSDIQRTFGRNCSVGIEDVDSLQVVSLS